jgi:hypothetical protein
MQKTIKARTASTIGIAAIALAIVVSMTALSLTGCDNGTTSPGIILPPIGKTLVSINVTTRPTKTVYAIGESLSTAGMVVTAAYSDGTTEAVTGYTTSGFDSSSAGQKTVTVSYEGTTTTFTVTVSGGTGNQTPTAEDFTVNGLSQIFDGNPKTVTITPKQGKSTGAITVYYNGVAAAPSAIGSYPVTFDVAAVEGWNAVTGLSAGTLVIAEQTANPQTPTAADFEIGNLTQTVGSVTAVTITPKQGKSDGAITIFYNGSTTLPTAVGSYTVTFNVGAAVGWNAKTGLNAGTLEIAAKTVTGIAITTQPAKTTYNVNEELDTSGMVVTATYSDNSTEAVTDYTVSGYDKLKTGSQTITVTYSGKTAAFTVNVILQSLQTVATPTASPSAGTYTTAQTVTLNTTTSGAAIYYTTDGTTPTTASTLYSGAITIDATGTLKAFAVKEGMNNSGILTAAYTINPPITLTENVWADGNLPTGNDVQWFKFTATANTQYIHTYVVTLTALFVQVYDSSGNTVGSEKYINSYTTEGYVSLNVTVGQVYSIKVRPEYYYHSGTYKIAFNTTFAPPGSATQLTENTWADGNLPTSSDVQWFKFTATASTQYIHVSFGTMNYLRVYVYDSSGVMVESEKHFYSSNNSNSWSVTVGQEYYIKTWNVDLGGSSFNLSGTYNILYNTSSAEIEKLPTNATQLTENIWADGNLPTSTDEQWYKFTATANTQYIHVSFGTMNYLRVYVYASSGAQVENEKHFYSSNKYNSWSVTVGQEYYIKTWNTSGSGSGTYQIGFTSSSIAQPGTTITSLTENTWADGNLPTENDEQWFKFTATASTQYIHAGFGTLDGMYVQMYDSSGATVGSQTYLSNYNPSVSSSVTAGQEYFIRVRLYFSNTGTYRIGFTASTTPPTIITLPSTAIQLTENTWADGNLPTSTDVQWFKFTATAETQYILFNYGTMNYLRVYVYDSSGAEVGNETRLNPRDITSRTVTVGQEYYIKATPWSSAGGTYQIAFNTIPVPPGYNVITMSTAGENYGNYSGRQYFKFTATESTQLIRIGFTVFPYTGDVYIQVYDSSGVKVGNSEQLYISSSDNKSSTTRDVIVGQEYYIFAYGIYFTYSGAYYMKFN